MILDAIATTMNTTTLNSYPIVGDVEADLPFAVFSALQAPVKTKDGIQGYANNVVVTVLCADLDDLDDYNVAVRAAITNMLGNIACTYVEASEFNGGDPVYDEKLKCYRCDNEFLIDTKNL